MSSGSPPGAPPERFELGPIRLRRTRGSDAAALFECASDPEVARYMDWPRATSLDELRGRVEARRERWDSGTEYHWVLACAGEERAIGAASYRVDGHAAEFGFFVHRDHWGRGHATLVARALVEWTMATDSIWRVWATCDVENVASARVLEKAGLTLEGRLRRWAVRPNLSPVPRDAWLYARVR